MFSIGHKMSFASVFWGLLALVVLCSGTLSAAGICLPALSVRSDPELLLDGIRYMQTTGRFSDDLVMLGNQGDIAEKIIAQNPECCSVSNPTESFRSPVQWMEYYINRYKFIEVKLPFINKSSKMSVDNCGNVTEYWSSSTNSQEL